MACPINTLWMFANNLSYIIWYKYIANTGMFEYAVYKLQPAYHQLWLIETFIPLPNTRNLKGVLAPRLARSIMKFQPCPWLFPDTGLSYTSVHIISHIIIHIISVCSSCPAFPEALEFPINLHFLYSSTWVQEEKYPWHCSERIGVGNVFFLTNH